MSQESVRSSTMYMLFLLTAKCENVLTNPRMSTKVKIGCAINQREFGSWAGGSFRRINIVIRYEVVIPWPDLCGKGSATGEEPEHAWRI